MTGAFMPPDRLLLRRALFAQIAGRSIVGPGAGCLAISIGRYVPVRRGARPGLDGGEPRHLLRRDVRLDGSGGPMSARGDR
jgi:hypothetical protein